MSKLPVLEVRELTVRSAERTLLQNVSFTVQPGEWRALVGESGSGKSVTAAAVMGMLPQELESTGTVFIEQTDLGKLSKRERRRFCGRHVGMIFQDYANSLTPSVRVGTQLKEVFRFSGGGNKKEADARIVEVLEQAELSPQAVLDKYPFELSGGQLQRVAIAMAVIHRPPLLIADEATASLDASTSKKMISLIRNIQKQTGCAVLWITHDLHTVSRCADTVSVMYGGQMMEQLRLSGSEPAFVHPYSRLLFGSILRLVPEKRPLSFIPGDPAQISERGCSFALRCPYAVASCDRERPSPHRMTDTHEVSCHVIHQGGLPHEHSASSGELKKELSQTTGIGSGQLLHSAR
ncbi:ABC transporter ATP-binding protein [Lihuaxuella thermophila]|uniref:Peptide/nickel transport system ATP-binding protein n=1 Tax=Lihuaxuella thermophila TaxID=1173111 RepID=A0A1H8BHV1_9BACL|nr:ABC transporter ATP-binding protein [Lihuaxuella thermophila]SEM82461.1 peptide/nickel transport system ATP-binding protein [Lihuaxuella thermophila]